MKVTVQQAVQPFLRSALLIACLVGCFPSESKGAQIGFNFYGLSYHTDREAAEQLNFNEVNLGFGFQGVIVESKVGELLAEGGFFKDTFRETAGYIALGYKFRIGNVVRPGVLLARYTSTSVNEGNSVYAPLPVLSLRFGFISANFVYMAEHEPVNRFSWFGAYLTLYASKDKN